MTLNITQLGAGKPLVLFHGWGFDSQIWQPILPALIEKYQLYLVDLPGFGRSDYMSWESFQRQMLVQLPQTFAVMGWSLGGLYATRLAIEAPMRVTHVLNIASSPYFMQTPHWPGVKQHVFSSFYENLAANPKQTLVDFIRLQLRGHSFQAATNTMNLLCDVQPFEHLDTLCVRHNAGNERENNLLMGLRAGLDVLVNWDLRHLLIHLKQPVGYLFGRLDAITSYKVMHTMQEQYPRFKYHLFPKAAHAPFLSDQSQFISYINEFFI